MQKLAIHPLVKQRLTLPIVTEHMVKRNAKGNIAFKCTYCDGGENTERVGFLGICSDGLMRHNVTTRRWCRQNNCDCKQRIFGHLRRLDLEEDYRAGGRVCYECAMLRDWRNEAGIDHTEESSKDRAIRQDVLGGLSILTTVEPDMREEERYIFALYLIGEHVPSSEDGDGEFASGYVEADVTHRLILPPQVARGFRFWEYYANGSKPTVPSWGSGLFRYIHNTTAAQVLRDASILMRVSKEEELAREMLERFSSIRQVDLTRLGLPNGALTRTRSTL